MKPICLFLFRDDAARRRRVTVRSGRPTTTGPAQFLKIGNPDTPYGMDGRIAKAIMPPGVSIRTSFLPVLIAPKIPHGSEPRCDDMMRYTERASEGFSPSRGRQR
jgi:hypothetical protein